MSEEVIKSSKEIITELFDSFDADPPSSLSETVVDSSRSSPEEAVGNGGKVCRKKKSKKAKRSKSKEINCKRSVKKKKRKKKHKRKSSRSSSESSISSDVKGSKKKCKKRKRSASPSGKELSKTKKKVTEKPITALDVLSAELSNECTSLLSLDETPKTDNSKTNVEPDGIENIVVEQPVEQDEKLLTDICSSNDIKVEANIETVKKTIVVPLKVADVFVKDLIASGEKEVVQTLSAPLEKSKVGIKITDLKKSSVLEAAEAQAKLKAEKYEEGELTDSSNHSSSHSISDVRIGTKEILPVQQTENEATEDLPKDIYPGRQNSKDSLSDEKSVNLMDAVDLKVEDSPVSEQVKKKKHKHHKHRKTERSSQSSDKNKKSSNSKKHSTKSESLENSKSKRDKSKDHKSRKSRSKEQETDIIVQSKSLESKVTDDSEKKKEDKKRSNSKSKDKHHRKSKSPKPSHRSRSRSRRSGSRSRRKSRSKSRKKSRSRSKKRSTSRSKKRSRSKSRKRTRSRSRKRSRSRSQKRTKSKSPKRSRSKSPKKSKERSISKSRKNSSSRARKSRSKSRKRSLSKSKRRSSSKTRRSGSKSKKRSTSKSRRRSTSKTKRRSTSKSRKRSTSRSKKRSLSKSRRRSGSKSRRHSRSRSRRRSVSKTKRKSRSRSKKRSRSKTRRSTSKSRKRSLSKSRRKSRSRSRKRSRSKKRSRSRSRVELSIDKNKLLEIARKNALNMIKQGAVGSDMNKMAAITAGGKTVDELTDFCKLLSQKDATGQESISSGSCNSSDTESEKPFHHPFLLKDRPNSIVMNIRNCASLPVKTHQEKTAEHAQQLRLQFPVSSGQQHRKTENEWVPVSPKKTEPKAITQPPVVEKLPADEVVAVDKTEDPYPRTSFELPPLPPEPPPVFQPQVDLDIGEIVTQRLTAMRKLQDNPNDTNANEELREVQNKMKIWAESKNQPGLFTGSTGARVLSQAELASGQQAWAKKDQLICAQPVSGGMGMSLLQKMGWKPGEGLGKHNEGTLEPLKLPVKMDKRGLVCAEELPRKPPIPQRRPGPPNKANPPPKNLEGYLDPGVRSNFSHQDKEALKAASEMGKHPVSLLVEFCTKRHYGCPVFTVCFEDGPSHKKSFIFKVTVNGIDYKATTPSPNKKQAKSEAAAVCLRALGVLPDV